MTAGDRIDSQVLTIGGVVPSGAVIASIIPADVPLILSVEIESGQVDRVYADQDTMIRFPSFNVSTIPTVEGRIATI